MTLAPLSTKKLFVRNYGNAVVLSRDHHPMMQIG